MFKIRKFGFLTTLSLIAISVVHVSDQRHSKFKYNLVKSCSETPRPITKSLQQCWENSKHIETLILETLNVKPVYCVDPKRGLMSNKKLGIRLMRTSRITYCIAQRRQNLFDIDAIERVNNIQLSVSEIFVNPLVCIDESEILKIDCSNLDYLTDDMLFRNIVEQVHILQELIINNFGIEIYFDILRA